MIAFRHLIVILCALFLMLGFGIFIGAEINLGPEVSKKAADIKSLSDKLDAISHESDRDHALLRGNEDVISALTPRLVGHVLDGKRYAIIQTGDYTGATQAASSAITAAGGSVESVSVITDRVTDLDSTRLQNVVAQLTLPESDGSTVTPVQQLLKSLAVALNAGTDNSTAAQSDLLVLTSNGLVNESGDYTLPVSGVVIVGGFVDDQTGDTLPSALSASDVEQAMLLDLTTDAARLTVVGCEPFDAVQSSLSNFTSAGIGSVDCVDLPIGELDLPFALRDNDHIAYGLKSTSTRELPSDATVTAASISASVSGTSRPAHPSNGGTAH